MDVKTVKLESLTEDPNNARLHNEKNLTAIRTSLSRFGQVEPLVARKGSGVVIGGNGRLAAMRELGWKRVDVTYLDLTDEQATALGIALNRTGDMATWDNEKLAELVRELGDDEIIESMSFSGNELDAINGVVDDMVNSDEFTGATEISLDEVSGQEHECPKCGFTFDD